MTVSSMVPFPTPPGPTGGSAGQVPGGGVAGVGMSGDETDAINKLANQLNADCTSWVDTSGAAGTFNVTAAQMISGDLRITSGNTSTVNLPTAAALVAAMPNCQVGSAFEFIILNGGTGTATVNVGSGMTGVGTMNVATAVGRIYKAVVTNATSGSEAVSLISCGTTGTL